MLAKDIMTQKVITASPTDSVQQLARMLTEAGISGAPVINGDGELVGIVSEADVISKRGPRVQDVMHRSVITVTVDTSAEEACCLMAKNRINRIPVMDDGKLAGIITRNNIIRAIASGNISPDLKIVEPLATDS